MITTIQFRNAGTSVKEKAEQTKIDAILVKIHDRGLHSITWWERRTLRKTTERQRKYDL